MIYLQISAHFCAKAARYSPTTFIVEILKRYAVKLTAGKHSAAKDVARQKKKMSIRRRVKGTEERPRLCIFRSARHMYAQIIDDVSGATIVSASTLDIEGLNGSNLNTAKAIGVEVAKRALGKNIKSVVFDRNGYLYHGRVQALADGAREAGLNL